MTEPDHLPQRVNALETHGTQMREEVANAHSQAAAARVLAAAADRDVSEVRAELRAHTSSLNALRETQLEQGQVLDEHSRTLGEHSRILDDHTRILGEHTRILGEHSTLFGSLQAGISHIIELLSERRGAT